MKTGIMEGMKVSEGRCGGGEKYVEHSVGAVLIGDEKTERFELDTGVRQG